MAGRGEQLLRWAALALFTLTTSLTVAGLLLASASIGENLDVGLMASGLVFAVTGLLVSWCRPANPVGWLLQLSSLLGNLCNTGSVYGERALVAGDLDLPAATLVLQLTAPLWIPALVVPATLLLGRYPSGSVHGCWGRRAERAMLTGFALVYVGYAGSPQSVTDVAPDHLPPMLLPAGIAAAAAGLGGVLLLGGFVAVLVHAVVRLLHAQHAERQQLSLLLATAVLAVVLVVADPVPHIGSLAYASVPLAVAVGVLRYDLLGLDAVVRRTLLYGALTALVLAVFVAVTAALTAVLPRGRTPEVVAASLIAVGLVPARERLQTLVDRLVYGDRADPWSALHRLGTPVGGVADDALLPAVVGALSEGLRVPAVAVRRADGTTVAASGEPPPASLQHPLVLAGARLGTLVVAPRRGEDRLSSADLRLVAAVAPLVAVLLHTTQLTSELRAERARVVNATASERERLRQELHDGLGPSLTGVGMGLEALQRRVRADDAVAADLVSRLRSEVAGAVEEVRRILAALRPGVLDEVGLVGALERRAEQLTATTGLVVDVVVPVPVVGVPAAVEAAVLRTAEEALANVVRHAGATRCRVEVRVGRGAVQLAVTDDGTGLPVQREGGVGLSSMRARAEGLGGTFTARQDGGGTQVRAELPLAVTA